jgi:hypothetical protein
MDPAWAQERSRLQGIEELFDPEASTMSPFLVSARGRKV